MVKGLLTFRANEFDACKEAFLWTGVADSTMSLQCFDELGGCLQAGVVDALAKIRYERRPTARRTINLRSPWSTALLHVLRVSDFTSTLA